MIAVAGGRIADILGRKRIFIIGGLAFSAAALLGFTVDTLVVVAVRAFMGFCAGLILASTGGSRVDPARFDTP
jgi:MFS family permease